MIRLEIGNSVGVVETNKIVRIKAITKEKNKRKVYKCFIPGKDKLLEFYRDELRALTKEEKTKLKKKRVLIEFRGSYPKLKFKSKGIYLRIIQHRKKGPLKRSWPSEIEVVNYKAIYGE